MPDPKVCHCSHPGCRACAGTCTAPGTTPVKISYQGERKGTYRLCEPCIGGWRGIDGVDIQPQSSMLADLTGQPMS